MADELLWTRLAGSVADGQTGSDNDAEFKHGLDDGAMIREITMEVRMTGAEPDESGEVEVSKHPSFIGGTDQFTGFIRSLTAGVPATGATPNSGDTIRNKTWKFAFGQVPVKFQEKLHVSVSKTTDGVCSYRIDIGFEEDN